MAGGARKSGVLLGPRHFCFDGNKKCRVAPRHRVNVAHQTGTGAQGAGLVFCNQNRLTTLRFLQGFREKGWAQLFGRVYALHIDNLAAKRFEHLLNGGVFFS